MSVQYLGQVNVCDPSGTERQTACTAGVSPEEPIWIRSASPDITRDRPPLRINTEIFIEGIFFFWLWWITSCYSSNLEWSWSCSDLEKYQIWLKYAQFRLIFNVGVCSSACQSVSGFQSELAPGKPGIIQANLQSGSFCHLWFTGAWEWQRWPEAGGGR